MVISRIYVEAFYVNRIVIKLGKVRGIWIYEYIDIDRGTRNL